jgi:hypothetical protein
MEDVMNSDYCAEHENVPRNLDQVGRKLKIRAEMLHLIRQKHISIKRICAAFNINGAHSNVYRYLKFGYTWIISAERAEMLLEFVRNQPARDCESYYSSKTTEVRPVYSSSDLDMQLRSKMLLLIKRKTITIYRTCADLKMDFYRVCDFLVGSKQQKIKVQSLNAAEIQTLREYVERAWNKSRGSHDTVETRQWVEGIRHDVVSARFMIERRIFDGVPDIAVAMVEKAFKLFLAVSGDDARRYQSILDLDALYNLCCDIYPNFDHDRSVAEMLPKIGVYEESQYDLEVAKTPEFKAAFIKFQSYWVIERILQYVRELSLDVSVPELEEPPQYVAAEPVSFCERVPQPV